jgi:hypothetical protein
MAALIRRIKRVQMRLGYHDWPFAMGAPCRARRPVPEGSLILTSLALA